MAYGTELVLGWPFLQWDKLTDVKLPKYVAPRGMIALPWEPSVRGGPADVDPEELDPDGDTEARTVRDVFEPVLDAFEPQLRQAHHAALLELGFTPPADINESYPRYETPAGEREFMPFRLEMFYDPGEMGDSAEDAVIGVAISGRYFPTFADWKDAHGCMPMIFDAE